MSVETTPNDYRDGLSHEEAGLVLPDLLASIPQEVGHLVLGAGRVLVSSAGEHAQYAIKIGVRTVEDTATLGGVISSATPDYTKNVVFAVGHEQQGHPAIHESVAEVVEALRNGALARLR
jgi:bisphosphoglycerate-independent phosphoglycerate mutase (AlkP superfamily)